MEATTSSRELRNRNQLSKPQNLRCPTELLQNTKLILFDQFELSFYICNYFTIAVLLHMIAKNVLFFSYLVHNTVFSSFFIWQIIS